MRLDNSESCILFKEERFTKTKEEAGGNNGWVGYAADAGGVLELIVHISVSRTQVRAN